MVNEARRRDERVWIASMRERLMQFAHDASVELNVQDLPHLEASRSLLPAGSCIYVSHLPKQSFGDTLTACKVVKACGFAPIPHVPVRLLESEQMLAQLAVESKALGVEELLLVAGDYPEPVGPFASVAQLLRSFDLRGAGFERVSLGGHPEGHTTVSLEEIRRSELDKARLASDQGLDATFVTQFFFESEPFLHWARSLRSAGVSAGIRAGLAGPAKIGTLLRFAMRCGVGPSIKALGSRPGAFAKLLGEHGPEALLGHLAEASANAPAFQGIHLFCFGGYLRTCRWLHSLAGGHFELDAAGTPTVG